MRVIPSIIYTAFLLLLVSACSEDSYPTSYTVGETDNAITLRAGLGDEGIGVQTRATETQEEHDKHTPLTPGATAILRINGGWTGHTPNVVSQTTLATIGAISDKHNSLSMSPQLYWDDYGTANPANTAGRDGGLTILAASAGNKFTSKNNILDPEWTAFSWTLPTDQSNGWENADLLTSNNILYRTLKFDEVKTNTANDLLIFTHAMSKVTVNLTADEGFPFTNGDPCFETNPKVTLLGFTYSGMVNIKEKILTPTTSATADIQCHLTTGGAGQHVATFTALVFPGCSFNDDTEIIHLDADGNRYIVTAAKINEKIDEINSVKKFVQGKDYVFNIIVKKTKIIISATIKDWVQVDSEPVTPEINISADYGQIVSGNPFTKSYDFFRSLTMTSGYDADAGQSGVNPAATYTYDKASSTGSWNKTLFWPNHDTHYFFRGVYPINQTITNDAQDNEVIEVTNQSYTAGTVPSDLMIALPRSTGNCTHNQAVETYGICATKGTIYMNFEYAMSKVELRLKSEGTPGLDYVDLKQTGTKVEIVNGYNKGSIMLKDGLHAPFTDADKGDYKLTTITPATGFQLNTLDAIVPQVLADNVLFKITVVNENGTSDIYTAQVNKIKGAKSGEALAPITEWQHGEHYIYTLDVRKTMIKVTATITDWVTLTADEPIWM